MRCFCLGFVILLSSSAQVLASEADLVEFLEGHCADCHRGDEPEGSFPIDGLVSIQSDNAAAWQKIALQVASGNMPPDGDSLSLAAAKELTDAIRERLGKISIELEADYKLSQPHYANLINHEKLFDGSIESLAFSPPRLWRFHPEAYDSFIAGFGNQFGKGGPISKPFLVGDDKGLVSNYAKLMKADTATVGQLILNCRKIAQFQTDGFKKIEHDRKQKKDVEKIYRKVPESFSVILDSPGPATKEQIVAAVREEFLLVMNREPDGDESERFANLLNDAIEIGGKERGLRTMAMAVLLRPEAIYRMEVGLGKTDEHGRRMLSPFELAHAIAYALTDLPPNQVLLGPPNPRDRNKRPTEPSLIQLAESGELSTRDDVRKVVMQIWDNEQIEKPRILRFFREFFGYHACATVFKGERAGKEFATQFLIKDADILVTHFVKQDRDVLKELLTTDRYFVHWLGSVEEVERKTKYILDRIKPDKKSDRNYKHFITRSESGLRPIPQANPTWRKTVRFYNLNEETWDFPLDQPFSMPEGQRVGMLTHPAWLAAWSGNFDNDPIRRGKWIREHLLADSVPDLPITVNAAVPEDHDKTLRERLTATREEYCWQCHQKMDPLGLPFEAYDDFGRFRTEEGLGETRALAKPKRTKPVVTKGQVIDSADEELEGDVDDAHDLMHRLAQSPRVRQSFVRYAFRFWMGRNEAFSDSTTLIAADKAYAENQGSFRSMVIELLTSDSFLLRK